MIVGKEGFIGSHVTDKDDTIIYLDAIPGIEDCKMRPVEAFNRNTATMANMLETARLTGKKFVYASSAAAANPNNPYAASKAAGEAWCQAYRATYSAHISVLRFANVYGPNSLHKTSCVARMCRGALKNGIIEVYGDGMQKRDFVYVKDVAKAISLAPDGLFSVRTGKQHTLKEIAELIAGLSGASIVYKDGPVGNKESTDASLRPMIDYRDVYSGIEETFEWFKENYK